MTTLRDTIINLCPPGKIRVNRQEDACEILEYILDQLNPELRLPFQGEMEIKDTCLRCKHTSLRRTAFTFLKLHFIPTTSVVQHVHRLLQSETITQCRCACSQSDADRVDFQRSSTITKWPDTLFLHILRFGNTGSRCYRIGGSISITANLTLGSRHYRTFAQLLHHGSSPKSGHYTSIILQNDGKCLKYDDHRPPTPTRFNAGSRKRVLLMLHATDFAPPAPPGPSAPSNHLHSPLECHPPTPPPHTQTMSTTQTLTFSCQACDRQFTRRDALLRHSRMHYDLQNIIPPQRLTPLPLNAYFSDRRTYDAFSFLHIKFSIRGKLPSSFMPPRVTALRMYIYLHMTTIHTIIHTCVVMIGSSIFMLAVILVLLVIVAVVCVVNSSDSICDI